MALKFTATYSRALQGVALSTAALLMSGCADPAPTADAPVADTASTPDAATTAADTAAPTTSNASYNALGNEPGWSLKIAGNQLEYAGNYGETKISEAHAGAQVQGNVTRYAGKRLQVTVEKATCADTMVERRYRDKVTVVADGTSVTGCGGPQLPPEQLSGTNWEILSINGANALPNVATNLTFADGKVSGSAGCNNLSGSYTQNKASVSLTNLAATRKACGQPQMDQERSVVAALGKVTRHDFTDDGQLQLHGPAGVVMVLRQIF